MTVHLVYRSYGGDNDKDRPRWFGKLLCAASFVRAAHEAGLRVHWLNDGPIPEDRMRLMEKFGDVLTIAGGPVGMRRSYVTALRYAIESQWPDDDVVYFCEDDYLHLPDSLRSLQAVAEQSGVSYFALYGLTPEFANEKEAPGAFAYPKHWKALPPIEAGGVQWVHGVSTASTFGARLGALRQDYGIFRQAMFPFRHRFLDHETCVVYQGRYPYHDKEYVLGPRGDFVPGLRGVVRAAVLVPFRLALTVRAGMQSRHPHPLYTAAPNIACHAEVGVMNPGRDWDAVAEDARRWAIEQGLMAQATA